MLRLLLPLVLLVVGALSLTARQSDSLTAAYARVIRAQRHLEQVEAVRAVKRLQLHPYGHYVELGLWHDFAELFTDAVTTNYSQGVHGKEEVRSLFLQQVGQGKLGLADGRIYPHILFQPVVHLSPDGLTAKGRWRILAMLGGIGGTATWYSGVYENEYVLDRGRWKIGVLRSEPRATAAYAAAGWRDAGITLPTHYNAANVAKPVTEVANSWDGSTRGLSVLAVHVENLARRAAVLEDQGAVANLQDVYGYAIDRKQWSQAADLFTADGTLEIGQRGVYVGRESIRRGLGVEGPQGLRGGERNDHVYLQTLISVARDGRSAQARGVELIFSAAPGGVNGELSEGTFENTFVKQDGEWRIESVHFYPRMIVGAATGWASGAKPAPGPSKEFPPDRPSTSSYAIYPAFAVAPFHFDNPVTGQPPQYPEGVQATRPATTMPSAVPAVVRSLDAVETLMADLERSIATAEAYDAIENLLNAFGYGRDGTGAGDGRTRFASHLSQPVIEIDKDGRRAKVRARLLELQGTSAGAGGAGGPGGWVAGIYQGTAVKQNGTWQLQTFDLTPTWSGPYPGGWARP